MFSKKNRLPTKEFTATIQRGKLYKSNSFFIRIQKNEKGFVRTGVAVSKDLAASVVQKNYYKRIARHVLKEATTNIGSGYDIVLILKKTVATKQFEELKKEANDLLYKTGIKNK